MAFTLSSTFSDVMSDPAFGSFGRLIFPVHREHLFGSTLEDMGMTFYTTIDPASTVKSVNYLKSAADAGESVFFDIYTDEEKAADPEKNDTGLFFFRGRAGAPFAIFCPGGGFQFVGAIHSGFPIALAVSEEGYNAFTLIYRPEADKACGDLARAIEFVFDHAAELCVDVGGYSLWGESAGARMTAFLCSRGTEGYGVKKLPRAAVNIMQYTGHSDFSADDPPTYSNAGGNDLWHLDDAMEKRYNAMKAAGIPVKFTRYEGLPHGYALGIGSIAEGWHRDAIEFWEKYR
jgi:acetyl esterase/lipase